MQSAVEKDLSNSQIVRNENTATVELNEEKMKLRKDIRELEALNFQIECCLKISKFGDIKHLLRSSEPDCSSFSFKKIPDVDTEYTDELFRLAGTRCTKFTENEYVFGFTSKSYNSKDCSYTIQIKSDTDETKICKWTMPMSINMDSLLLETPLRNAIDLKPFLANCKHHIDCYANRVKQYYELQSVVAELSGCSLDSDLGHTIITMKLFDMQIVEYENSYNVVLYLVYESSRVRPHKITIDSLTAARLPKDVENKFKSYFKHFKRFELKNAFEEICKATDGPVKWMREQNRENLNLNDSSSSGSEVSAAWKPGKKQSVRHGLKRKVKETSLESEGLLSQEQRSDDSNLEATIAPESSLANSIDEGRENPPKTRVEQQQTNKVKKSEIPAAPKVAKKSKPTKTGKSSSKPSQSTAKKSLRQSTLKVPFEKPKEKGRPKSDVTTSTVATPTVATSTVGPIPSTDSSGVQKKSKTNVKIPRDLEFGTSTPVHNLNLREKRFVPLLSPIIPKHNMVSKKTLPTKTLG